MLPLLPLAFAGILVVNQAASLFSTVIALVGLPFEGVLASDLDEVGGPGAVVLELAVELALLVVASLLLRWLVRRWVVAQPPEPLRRA